MKTVSLSFAILLCSAFTLFSASTYYASPDGLSTAACTVDDPGTLDLALSKAKGATSITNGDTVILLPGIYWRTNSTINLNKKYLTLKGSTADPADTVFHGIGSQKYLKLFNITQYATIENLTITNYAGPYGYLTSSIIYSKPADSSTSPRVNNCIIAGCYDEKANYSARAIANGGVFTKCQFIANRGTSRAPMMGGAFFQFYDCTFKKNSGVDILGRGGDNETVSTMIISNCLFEANSVRVMSCAGKVLDSRFINNVSTKEGTISASSVLVVSNCYFKGNEASRGGCTYGNNIRAIDCQFIENKTYDNVISTEYGGGAGYGGIYSNCLFTGNYIRKSNRSYYGGALRGGKAVNCFFDSNNTSRGGATYDTITIGCVFTNNSATKWGSANYGGTHTNGLYIKNSYTATSDANGGILYGGSFVGCTFMENTSSRYIGYNSTMQNCLVVSNTITGSGYSVAANGVYINSTITGNKTVNKAAITGGTYTNTIVIANDNSLADVGGGTHIHTLYNTYTGTPSFDEGSIKTASARFCGNGTRKAGPWALKASSPAKDAGVAVGPFNESTLDIYGNPRIYKTIDIGCSEFIPFSGLVLMVK